MKIWVTRHGQTDYNKKKLMQGRIDIPLNKTGIAQAECARKKIDDIYFDAVYSSPLQRAIDTAAIIGAVSKEDVIKDNRLIEASFGKYEGCGYYNLGFKMSAYWMFPELFHAPDGVESIASMIKRSASIVMDIEKQDYNNVLIVCHGGIIRTICGYLDERPNKIKWRPRPKNCELRVYLFENGNHKYIKSYHLL